MRIVEITVNETVNQFLKLNKLKNDPIIHRIPNNSGNNDFWIEKRFWNDNRYQLIQLIVYGGGHTLPGTNPLPSLIFGKTYKNHLIADEIIDFFLK